MKKTLWGSQYPKEYERLLRPNISRTQTLLLKSIAIIPKWLLLKCLT